MIEARSQLCAREGTDLPFTPTRDALHLHGILVDAIPMDRRRMVLSDEDEAQLRDQRTGALERRRILAQLRALEGKGPVPGRPSKVRPLPLQAAARAVPGYPRHVRLRADTSEQDVPPLQMHQIRPYFAAMEKVLTTAYDSLFLDVDGTIIDAYDATESPVADRLSTLAMSGVPIAIATGREASGVATLLGGAGRFPGAWIIGKNGMDVLRASDGEWRREAPVFDPEWLTEYEQDYAVIKAAVQRACAAVPELHAVVTKVKERDEALTVSVNTFYREFTPAGSIPGEVIAGITDLLLEHVSVPEHFAVQAGGDGLQIRPRWIGKLASCLVFKKRTGASVPLVIADQPASGDQLVLHAFGGVAVDGFDEVMAKYTEGGFPPHAFAPLQRTAGTAYILDRVHFELPPTEPTFQAGDVPGGYTM